MKANNLRDTESMDWNSIAAIERLLKRSTLRASVKGVRIFSTEDISASTKSVIFDIGGDLQIAIPPGRMKIVSIYVPSHSVAGEPLPEDVSAIHSGVVERERYPRADGRGIAASVLRGAPSLDPSRKPRLVEAQDPISFEALVNWLLGAPLLRDGTEDDVEARAGAQAPANRGESVPVDSSTTASRSEKEKQEETRLEEDVREILGSAGLTPTEREQLVMARIGQGRFRRNVAAVWGQGERCAATGIEVREVLIASHIIAWRDSEKMRLQGTNGILLCAHLDRLFDAHLASFDSSGRIVLSKRLSKEDRDELSRIGVVADTTLQLKTLSKEDLATVKENLAAHHRTLVQIELKADVI